MTIYNNNNSAIFSQLSFDCMRAENSQSLMILFMNYYYYYFFPHQLYCIYDTVHILLMKIRGIHLAKRHLHFAANYHRAVYIVTFARAIN